MNDEIEATEDKVIPPKLNRHQRRSAFKKMLAETKPKRRPSMRKLIKLIRGRAKINSLIKRGIQFNTRPIRMKAVTRAVREAIITNQLEGKNT